jgi:hypothetical protein
MTTVKKGYQSMSHTYRLRALLGLVSLLLVVSIGCGGGTYGTGGRGSRITVRVTSQSLDDSSRTAILTAGTAETFYTNSNGYAEILIRDELTIQIIRVVFSAELVRDYYYRTDDLLAASGPITLELEVQNPSEEVANSDGDTGDLSCEAILDSWAAYAVTPDNHLSSGSINLISQETNNPDRTCDEKRELIANSVFEN